MVPRRKILGEKGSWEKEVPRRKRFILAGTSLASRWRNGGAREWEALETGRRWRLVSAGDWLALETGRRWPLHFSGPYISRATTFLRPLRRRDAKVPAAKRILTVLCHCARAQQ